MADFNDETTTLRIGTTVQITTSTDEDFPRRGRVTVLRADSETDTDVPHVELVSPSGERWGLERRFGETYAWFDHPDSGFRPYAPVKSYIATD